MRTILILLIAGYLVAHLGFDLQPGQRVLTYATSAVCWGVSQTSGGECGYKEKRRTIAHTVQYVTPQSKGLFKRYEIERTEERKQLQPRKRKVVEEFVEEQEAAAAKPEPAYNAIEGTSFGGFSL